MGKSMVEDLRWLAKTITSGGEAKNGLIRIRGLGRISMSRAVGLLTTGAAAVSVKGTPDGRYDITLPGEPADHWLKLLGPYLAGSREIYADYNARTADDRVRLSTAGSLESLRRTPAKPGDWAWISDGEVRTLARIEGKRGELLANPVWAANGGSPSRPPGTQAKPERRPSVPKKVSRRTKA